MITIKTLASGSAGNCYRIEDAKTTIMLECGIRFKKIIHGFNFKLSKVAGCLISHYHIDHAHAVKDVMKRGIDCYMSSDTAQALRLSGHRLKIIESLKQFKIGTWNILPFDSVHDTPGSLGFLLQTGSEKLLFLTDSAFCKYTFSGLTHLMLECNYQDYILNENVENGTIPLSLKNRIIETHLSLDNVIKLLKANDLSNLKEVHLLHLSDDNSNAGIMLDAVRQVVGVPVYIAGRNNQ